MASDVSDRSVEKSFAEMQHMKEIKYNARLNAALLRILANRLYGVPESVKALETSTQTSSSV